MSFDDDFNNDEQTPSRPEPTTKMKRTNGLFGSLWSGHHGARYSTPVPEGVDPNTAANAVSRSIATHPAPNLPRPMQTPLVKPSEHPQQTYTMGQPAFVSQASSADHSENSVDVQADPDHILGGADGNATGITYSTTAKARKRGGHKIVTEKESYGNSTPLFNPLRALVGRYGLDPHMRNVQAETIEALLRQAAEKKE